MHEPSLHAYRTLLPVLVLVLAGTACQARPGTATTATPEKTPQGDSAIASAPAFGTTAVDCGQPFTLPPAGLLELTGRFPAEASAGDQTLSGTVDVLSSQDLRGVARPGADVFLVRDGRVVTTPLPQDALGILWAVAAGEPKTVPAEAALAGCASGQPLDPGSYELYARLTVVPDGGGSVESFGGPWSVEVR